MASRISKVGAKGSTTAKTPAAMSERLMVRTRPPRSATNDQGRRPTTTPSVATEIISPAWAGETPKSRAMIGRMPCGEYSCAKVAIPAASNATRMRAYPRLPGWCPRASPVASATTA